MKKALFRFAVIGAFVALVAGSAVAKDHDRDRDRDHHRARFESREHRRDWAGDRDRRFRYVNDRSHDRQRERARAEWRERERQRERARRAAAHPSSRPPGWSKGKKTGWGDCDVPPGQAKKAGCTPHDRREHHANYPRTEGRRPVIVGRTPATSTTGWRNAQQAVRQVRHGQPVSGQTTQPASASRSANAQSAVRDVIQHKDERKK